MNPDIFTHTFEFNFNGVEVKGEVEFNTDKKVSMDIKQSGVPLPAENMQLILDFFEIVRKMTENNGVINVIKIKKKQA